MHVPVIKIITPADASANNGNWRTAQRWSRFLSTRGAEGDCYEVILQSVDTPDADGTPADLLIALHATRSHAAIARWRDTHPDRPIILILSGTDLYRDLPAIAATRNSMTMADRLVVLQDHAMTDLPAVLRSKARVIYQSTALMAPCAKPVDRLDCVFVGHLRDEKDPLTTLRAWHYLAPTLPITLTVVGAALDESLVRALKVAARWDPRIRFAGAQSHEWTLQAIRHAHLLINSSRMEGGAHVIAEALRAHTQVLASRMPGNMGMLGRAYPGYFGVSQPRAIADLLRQCLEEPHAMAALRERGRVRRKRFEPGHEQHAVKQLVAHALEQPKIVLLEHS